MSATSVYVHFPFCLKRCPYCDFVTEKVEREEVPHVAYADAVLRELDARAGSIAGRELVSIFFGGGTPSLWDPRQLGRVVAGVRGAFSAKNDVEISVECNPSSLDTSKAAALREAGVNRLSIGVQTLDDSQLVFLGRAHDQTRALKAVREAVREVPRASLDLMFGMPGQKPDALAREIARVIDAGVAHVSAYALTIEPETPFGALHRKGKLEPATDDAYAELYEIAETTFASHGFAHYEVSNYARPGEEARHNQHYWRGGAYLALGTGAVGCLESAPGQARRYRNTKSSARYLAHGGIPEEDFAESLGAQDLVREALMLGLRTSEGVDLARTRKRAGTDPLEGRREALATRIARGDVVHEADRLFVPRERWLALDGIVASLF